MLSSAISKRQNLYLLPHIMLYLMKKKYTLQVLLIVFFVTSFGLNSYAQSAKRLAKKGDKYLGRENYHEALNYYNRALSADSSNVRALYGAGIVNMTLFSNSKSVDYLLKAYEKDPKFDKHYQYWLGRAYHVNMQYDKAVEAYRIYINDVIGANDSRQESVKGMILQAEFAKTYQNNPVDFYAQPLAGDINSLYSDHSPILTQDKTTMYFTSRRPQTGKDGKTIFGDGWENIYTSRFSANGWTAPSLLPGNVNQKKRHVSNVQLFDNDSKMLLYQSVKFGSLFLSENSGGSWSKPKQFSRYTNTTRFEPNGFVIKDESVVYFASSRGNKNGNLDLWVSRRSEEDSTWSEPERLPNIINTDADEDAPFLSADGLTLYFCSRGHDSMGGYDVYKTTYEPFTKAWSKPLNLGFPVNTPSDDIYFVTDSLGKVSYVSSNRTGTRGQEDLFIIKEYEEVLVKGKITAKGSGTPLPDYILRFDSQRKMTVKGTSLSGPNGVYGLRLRSGHTYTVEIKKQNGETVLTDEVQIPAVFDENSEIVKNFEVEVPDSLLPTANDRIVLKNLNLVHLRYSEFDSLIISGEVRDNAGTIAGADVRLRYEDSPKILYNTRSDANGMYQFSFVPGKKTDYVIEILKPDYLPYNVVVLYTATTDRFITESDLQSASLNRLDIRSILTTTYPVDIREGVRSVIGGVYFEFNSANLLPESSIALDRLYEFLRKYPRLVVEIGGHTDILGTPYVNKFISQKRAQAVVNYLVKKGIPKKRLTSFGYGETQPITTNDRELNGRDVNRRVEMKILKK
jgi:outer membrane protein OmpA-like peptidoglycan-associated protein